MGRAMDPWDEPWGAAGHGPGHGLLEQTMGRTRRQDIDRWQTGSIVLVLIVFSSTAARQHTAQQPWWQPAGTWNLAPAEHSINMKPSLVALADFQKFLKLGTGWSHDVKRGIPKPCPDDESSGDRFSRAIN